MCPVTSGGYLLLDSADVTAAFSDKSLSNRPSRFSALAPKNRTKYEAADVAANIPPFLDTPEHVQVRRWLSRAFFDRYKVFAPQIAQISAQHVNGIATGQDHLLVEDIAREYVVDTIGRFTGIVASPDEMKQFTSAMFRLFAPAKDAETFAQTNTNLRAARQKIQQALAHCRADQTASLLTTLDAADVPVGEGQSKDNLIADNALLILADGVENVEAAIAFVMIRWFECLEPRPDIDTAFVRETIRQNTPGQTIARIAASDMQIRDEQITAGTPVFLSLASANASAEDQTDFSFGMGRHKCIGEQLAVAMITTFCCDLAARLPHIDTTRIEYLPMFGHKWSRKVVVRV